MILTDFDTDGIKIAFQLEGITRIGIDFESVDQINEQLEAELNGDDPFAPETPEVEPVEDEARTMNLSISPIWKILIQN